MIKYPSPLENISHT